MNLQLSVAEIGFDKSSKLIIKTFTQGAYGSRLAVVQCCTFS